MTVRIDDFRPTNPFSWILFVVAMACIGGAFVCGYHAFPSNIWWLVAGVFLELGAGLCLSIIRVLESDRVRDEEIVRRDREADARPYEPEGDP